MNEGGAKSSASVVRSQRWLNETVVAIALASLFSDIGHEMATASLPVLISSFGGTSASLGLIEGLADGAASFIKLLSGIYTDHLSKRKPLAVFGYLMTALGMASFALSTRVWHVLLGRIIGWIGRGARTPVKKVLLTEATTPSTYGRAFGFERAMDTAGAIVGPLLSMILVAAAGLKFTFAFTLIPGGIAALLIAFLVRERKHSRSSKRESIWNGVLNLPRPFLRYLTGVGIAGLGDFSKSLLIFWATIAWTPEYGIIRAGSLAIAFYTGYNVIYSISCFWSGYLADRYSQNLILASGYLLATIPALSLMISGTSFTKFALVFGFSGLYMGVWETVESSTAAALLRSSERGTGFGILATVNGLGDLISSVAVGALWVVSSKSAMLFVIVTAVIGAIVILKTKTDGPRLEKTA